MSWDEGPTAAARFEHARQTGHVLHAHWRLGVSYGGFIAALSRWSERLVPRLVRRFQRQMQQRAGDYQTRHGWRAFAADGSRLEAPHTAANEEGLGCAGRKKTAPQVFVTTLWHLGLGLPWDFRVGPGTDSERAHLEDLLPGLPAQSLVIADAGFIGYELCQRILAAGHSFLLRVGSNRTLLTELGWDGQERAGLVYLWPEAFRQRPPLVLRLITLRRGEQTLYLLSNVLDEGQLSDAEAGALYELRWGVEVGYRSYKQTLDRRRLLSRTPQHALAEAQWTLLGLWLLGLLNVTRLLEQQVDPRRGSVAQARDAVRRALRQPAACGGRRWPRLRRALAQAVQDGYARRGSKAARNYPRKKREKPPGPPKIQPATPKQRQRAARLREQLATAA